MDPFTVAKLGDVTIQRVPPKSDDSKVNVVKDPVKESISNNITHIQLPKLPPSINITVKSAPTASSSTSDASKTANEVRQIHIDANKSVTLSREVELRRREDAVNSETEASNSTSFEPNETNENTEEVAKETDENHIPADTPLNDGDVDKSAPDASFPSDYEYEDESDELQGIAADSDHKMELDDSMDPKSKSDPNESDLNPDDEPSGERLEDDVDPVEADPVEDEEYREDECVPDDIPDDIPAIPIEVLAPELTTDIMCKEEQYSDKELTNESDDADDECDKDQNGQSNQVKTKKKRKPKLEDDSDEDSNDMKKQKTSQDDESADSENNAKTASEIKIGSMRRNIREVMDETKLEEATLAAQRQEMERLRRVQEQQKIIRDVQRQIAQNRQNSKMQARVLSLLQKGTTSIIKKEEEDEETFEEKKPNTVVVKLSTGSGPPQIVDKKVLDMLKKQNSAAEQEEEEVAKEKLVVLSKSLDKPQMMTASVSIAPVKPESKPAEPIVEKELEDEEKSKDVVMISSSSDEEDDCIVISEEEEESEPDEDPTNSGMHTNDLYNVPDEQGRVLINVGHPDSEKDVYLAPQIARIIKPHQIGGVRFLFDNIVESLDRYNTSEGFGCILAHSMGLGKTLQVVSFCDVFLRYTEGKTVLCIMPINTLQNWVAEFNMWLPTDPDSSPLKEQGEVLPRSFPLFVLNDNQKTLTARANVIQNWHREGGVLLIGYELYRQLSLKKPPKSRNRSKRKTEAEEDLEDEKCKNLLETMYSALVKPGPDLVICDEGHRIKNSHASISQALKQIRSKRRVVLTGYPLQNNLLEYWCMVDFVRPNYLGTKTEFSNMFERPIQNGQCIDSTPQDIKLMRYRAHVLHSLLEGFVQRRSHSVLQQTLPSKYEYVLLLRMTSFQRGLYNTFMNEVVRTKAVPNPLKAFAVCCKIWNHPDILYNFLKKRAGDEELDLDLEETAVGIGTPASGPSTPMTPSTPPHQGINKRSRSGRGGKAGKEAKLPRKNARINAPQTNTKTPLIAAVPPNTASNTKPTSPEEPTASTNNQPSAPFNSYNDQFQNFNQQNENFGDYNQPSGANQNYNSHFNQEYNNASNATNNQDYGGTNYQQNFADSNFYQGEYNQNNYWEGGNFYNSNTSSQASNEEYYKQNSTANSQFNSNEYNANAENAQGSYNSSNYNFDMNSQQMNYANDFNVKQESSSMSHYNMGENSALSGAEMLTDGSDMSNQMFADTSSNEMTYDTSRFGQNMNASRNNVSMMGNMNEPMMNANEGNKNRRGGGTFNASQARNVQGQARFPGGNDFNVFGTQRPKQSPRMATPRARGVRSGAVGRPRKNANCRAPNKETMATPDEEFKFKPGLPGGAPVMKQGVPEAGQNFQNVPAQMDGHLMGSQLAADDLNNVFSQNPLGANFLDSLRSEELWNPNAADQNTLFEQNYMYDDGNQMLAPNANFIANEAPSLLGGVRATRSMLNEIQPNDNLFPGVQSNYSTNTVPPIDTNLFSMDNFNYLHELQNANYQMSSHTNFMGLLEGENNLGIGPSAGVSDDIMKTTQFNSAQLSNPNYMDSMMQYQNTDLSNPAANVAPSSSVMNTNKNVSFEPARSNDPLPSLPVEKDVSQSIMGLARRGQITLKVVDKKVDSRNEPAESNVEPARPPQSAAGAFQNPPNRLPSIDIFNTSQNFVSTAQLSQDTMNYTPIRQFAYADNQTNTGNATTNQPNQRWENFDVSANNEFNAQTPMNEKPQQFGFPQNQIMQPPSTSVQENSQYESRNVTNAQIQQDVPKEPNQLQMPYGSDNRAYSSQANTQDNTPKEEPRRVPQSAEKVKLEENKSNKNVFPANKNESSKNTGNKTQTKMNPPVKASEKKAPRRNAAQASRTDAKQFHKNESFGGQKQAQNESQHSPGVTISSSLPTTKPTIPKGEIRERPIEDVEIPDVKMPAPELPAPKSAKEEPGIPYEWTNEFFKDYEPGKIEASAKTLIFFCMLEEIIRVGDRLLLFSQSLFTLDLIEDFLQMFNIPGSEEKWARNKSYFRLDGSTSALEREKLINEFNSNPNVHLFLVSTRAGSLGINLVGANRVVVFDASWNPCHDTQAVCRVYRYGQQKSCYVYRFVMDNCLEKKIYDRQINKQGMSDRVVDECNPDAHLTIKDVSNLCWDNEDVSDGKKDFRDLKDKYNDLVIQTIIEKFSSSLSKEPFQHESLLVDRKDNKLSQAEKRMAKRSYELEKQASLRPSYGFYNNPHSMQNRMGKPMASVRPMQVDNSNVQREGPRRWIPAEVWQKQGMSAQEMTLPLDVVIPTNTSDSRSSIVLKAGQKVMVLKSPKGIYMQLENGKIIAIKTAVKTALGQSKPSGLSRTLGMSQGGIKMLPRPSVDRPLSSIGGRRDVTVSPIRNRFAPNMRTNPNMPMGAMRPGFARGPRPGQPIVRTFPLARPQGSQPSQSRPVRPPIPGTKQIFGPNSSVTISLANKKKMESQAEQANTSDMHYEDYNSINRLKDMQNMPLGRRAEEEGKSEHTTDRRNQFGDSEGITSRMLDSSSNLSASRPSESNASRGADSSTKTNPAGPTKGAETAVSKVSPNFSDVIPESLRFKKDINLTPVRSGGATKSDVKSVPSAPKSMPPKATPSASFQTQQHYATQQQKPAQPKAPPTSAAIGAKGNMKTDSNATRGKLPIPESILAKKDVQVSVKAPELPVQSSSKHSISIFPINKKPEEDNQPSESAHQTFEGEYQSKNATYFNDYQKPYRDYYQDKHPPETGRYSNNPYETFKPNYPSGFPQQQSQRQEYQSQSQHSYGSAQYSSVPYSSHDFGTTSYGADNGQYNSMFSNQSHTPTSSSFNSYDQYAWQNYPQQSAKTGTSQHSPGQPPPQPPPQ